MKKRERVTKIYKSVASPGIKIITNMELYPPASFQFNDPDLLLFQVDFSCNSSFEIRLGRYVKAAEQGKKFCFEQEFLGKKISIYIEGLETKPTKLYISNFSNVLKIPLPVRDLVRPGDLISSVILVKAIQYGWLLAHAAALFSEQHGGILITGYPDTGKSTTTYLLSHLKGFLPLSDDLTWISENGEFVGEGVGSLSIYSSAEQRAFYKYVKLVKVRIMLSTLLRYIYYLPYAPQFLLKLADKLTTLQSLPSNHKMLNPLKLKYRCDRVFILEQGKENIVEIDRDIAAKKFLEINRREHHYLNHNFILLTYSYLNNNFSLETVYRERERIISDFVRKVRSVYVVRAPNPRKFTGLITNVLERV